jgi:hypothetical protein
MTSEARLEKVISFLKKNIEPLPDAIYGPRYRVSATLKDGLVLPCIVFQGANKTVDLAIKRFEETKGDGDKAGGYRAIVKNFVASGNSINEYDIQDVSESPFAIPVERMKEIGGETATGWTGFTATMKDGASFYFGTSFNFEFFNMPPGYKAQDIVKITPAQRGVLPKNLNEIHQERPYFTCCVDGL